MGAIKAPMERGSTISRAKALADSPYIRLILRALQLGIVALVLFYILQSLSEIGWRDVWAAFPTSPLFYAMFLAMYFALPIGEWLVYRTLWGEAVKRRFDLFLRMRIYNLALVSYAGEAFLAIWAHRNLAQSGKAVVSAVKDSNILSALASNTFTVMLLAAFFFTGQLGLLVDADPNFERYIGLTLAVGALLIPGVLLFRGKILALSGRDAKRVFGIHLCRLVCVLLLQAGQWALLFPNVPFDTWLLLLTAQMVLTRVPFLPNTDLLFMGLGITLMGYIDGVEAEIAGMFLATGALSQLLNLGGFLITGLSLRGAQPEDAPTETSSELAAETR